ncbi:MAG: class II aldolase/adducin family protein [Clostridiales bacterium]|jgi:L-fuculose-phosphate aldolase|nr:class II aldolase/adducin family protein [Clostridiales bacterium]
MLSEINETLSFLSSLSLTDGGINISVKKGADEYVMTSPSADYQELKDGDLECLPIVIPTGNGAGESEYTRLYRAVYAGDPTVGAVIIAATPYLTKLSERGTAIPPILDDFAQIIGPSMRVAWETDQVITALKKRNGCMIKGRGALVTGRNLTEAATALLVAEKTAKTYILAQRIGKPIALPYWEAVLMNFIYKKKYRKTLQ